MQTCLKWFLLNLLLSEGHGNKKKAVINDNGLKKEEITSRHFHFIF